MYSSIQAYLGDIEGSIPDHGNVAKIPIKQVLIFLLMGGSWLQFIKSNIQTNKQIIVIIDKNIFYTRNSFFTITNLPSPNHFC